ncbi:MAG TPA: MarR family transcriptional regulator [Lachnospiraceae bacterium]|nr:MarR family transcriptional regulator [Lachnospiraceae bacterium]
MHNSNAREFIHSSGEINSLYHKAAVKAGISDSVLNILYVLCEKEYHCLQSDIFRLTGMSRQTINSAIRKLEKDNFVRIEKGTGRNTIVRLTDKGRQFADKSILPLFDIENKIWNEWTIEEQQQYLILTKKYYDSFKKFLKEDL